MTTEYLSFDITVSLFHGQNLHFFVEHFLEFIGSLYQSLVLFLGSFQLTVDNEVDINMDSVINHKERERVSDTVSVGVYYLFLSLLLFFGEHIVPPL